MKVTFTVSVSVAVMTSFARILDRRNPVFAPADQSTKTPTSLIVSPPTSAELKNLSKYATLSTLNLFVNVPLIVSVTSCVSLFETAVEPLPTAK